MATRRRPAGTARRGKGRGGRPLLVAAGLAAGSTLAVLSCRGGDGQKVRVVVPRGASLRDAADSLEARGVIGSGLLFRLYAKSTGQDRAVKPGTYLLGRGTPYGAVLDALVTGRGMVHVVTIVEGWELRQIVPQIARSLGVPRDSVEAAVRDTALLRRLDVPTPTLEGYLFPATYTFPDGTGASTAVRTMVERFEQAWKAEWNDRLQSLALRRHDAVTLASIVEREARRPEERPVIAAVYYNRLRKGMRLQADPTIQYALGRHVGRVLYKDLEIDSPYNTYRRAGLPPGPIGSPGAPSMAAAVAPASVPYLYFVAHPDGHHEFRTTYAEHLTAVEEARRLTRQQDRADTAVPRSPARSR
ncbi:MAG TPA: endolytic transglycosylase MltG [Gemmatirosa sp.]|nr:endolytic transglycosylase MltG [Gemmatirosa sp.]